MTFTTLAAAASEQLVGIAGMLSADSAEAQAVRGRLPRFLGVDYQIVGVVRPSTAEELAATVGAANRRKLAILRVYSSSNVGARLSGGGPTLVIDLSRMTRVLAVDPQNATVRVEPGVTYAQLADHFERAGLPLLVDSERDPDASIAASVFSKGIGRTPYGDHLLVQCGAEFALPGGTLLRTGMGAMEDNVAWQLYKYALGPYSDGLAVQSDRMIPTQVGLWVMGQVPDFRHFAYDLDDDAALRRAVEAIRSLKIGGTLAGTIVITHREFDRQRGATKRNAEWRLQGAHYGLPRVVALSMAATEAALGGTGQAVSSNSSDLTIREEVALMEGRPGLAALQLSKVPNPPFLTFVAPIEGEHAVGMKSTANGVLRDAEQPLAVEFLVVGRSLLMNCYIALAAIGASSADESASLVRNLVSAMGEAGYGVVGESPEFHHVVEDALKTDQSRKLSQMIVV